jgi:hypothetical protein
MFDGIREEREMPACRGHIFMASEAREIGTTCGGRMFCGIRRTTFGVNDFGKQKRIHQNAQGAHAAPVERTTQQNKYIYMYIYIYIFIK